MVNLKTSCQIAYPFFTSPSQYEFLPRYSELKESLHAAIKTLLRERLEISIEAVPPCFLIGFEKYYADYIAERMDGFVPFIKEEDFLPRGEVFEKAYTKKCFVCDYRPACAGIDIEYLLNFGDSEINPVKIER